MYWNFLRWVVGSLEYHYQIQIEVLANELGMQELDFFVCSRSNSFEPCQSWIIQHYNTGSTRMLAKLYCCCSRGQWKTFDSALYTLGNRLHEFAAHCIFRPKVNRVYDRKVFLGLFSKVDEALFRSKKKVHLVDSHQWIFHLQDQIFQGSNNFLYSGYSTSWDLLGFFSMSESVSKLTIWSAINLHDGAEMVIEKIRGFSLKP